MTFKLLSNIETAVLKTVVSSGENPISALELEKISGIPKRTAYNALIGMTAVGILDQVKTQKSKRGRPVMGYTTTDLGKEVYGMNNKVLNRAASLSIQAATGT